MVKKSDKPVTTETHRLVKAIHPSRPDWNFSVIDPGPKAVADLVKPILFPPTCSKACTRVVQLLPKILIQGKTGIGFPMVNVDGFRWINAYVISDPLSSTLHRGFSLSLSFAVNPFVAGVGVSGETSFSFNFDSYFDPTSSSHRLLQSESSDLTTAGGLPSIGGNSLAHVLRAPVMGPFVRASAFNEDTVARHAEVKAYLVS